MKILGIESASMTASVALVAEGITMGEYTVDFKKTHSQTLLPMIHEMVRMLEFDLKDLDGIAVSGGPGSFTGLRIGSATAKGLGLALDLWRTAWWVFAVAGILCAVVHIVLNPYRDED